MALGEGVGEGVPARAGGGLPVAQLESVGLPVPEGAGGVGEGGGEGGGEGVMLGVVEWGGESVGAGPVGEGEGEGGGVRKAVGEALRLPRLEALAVPQK